MMKRNKDRRFLLLVLVLLSIAGVRAQDLPSVIVDVNLDVLHQVGGQDSLDRSRFITIHSNPDESDWDGLNFTPDLRDHFLNGYDVYTGRSTGGITWQLKNKVAQNPSKPGHVLASSVQALGASSRSSYAGRTNVHPYEYRHKLVLCAQFHPFWPDGTLTNMNWALSQTDTEEDPFGTATGEYMGLYTKNFFGGNGPQMPFCIEIINEPLWELVTNGTTPPSQCFKFHNNVAAAIREHVPDIPIGGYTAAFPDFDKDNFQRWHDRDKLFFDLSGEHMDFISLHLYDFPSIGGKELYRKGSNVEATFDMMEQYSSMTLGKVLPFEVSEYGSQTHDQRNHTWTAYRDWLRLKSITSLLLSYLERPDHMLMTVPFTVLKAEWGRSGDIPYGPRLMRQAKEADGESGDEWVYTELVLFYQLWSEVKGKRVDTKSTDLDFLCDAYVNGNEAFIIVSNLEFGSRSIGLKPQWAGSNNLESVNVKHMYLKNNYPVLENTDFTEAPSAFTLGSEGAMVVKYTFSEPLIIPDSSKETKYYATTYLQEIQTGVEIEFRINGVSSEGTGEAVLRLGIGRDHELSLVPDVLFNGTAIDVPVDFRGGTQKDRNNFFGVIEIPVPYELLQDTNRITVTFPDNGGFVSSAALQVFEQSRELIRSDIPDIFNLNFNIYNDKSKNPIVDAEVQFEGQLYYSDEQGHVLVDSLEIGKYGYSISAEGFDDYPGDSVEVNDNVHLDIAMDPVDFDIQIYVSETELDFPIPNAKVSLASSTGYTDSEGQTLIISYTGSSRLMVERDYFETYDDSVNITSDTSLNINLLRLFADVRFDITDRESGSRLKSALVTLPDTSIVANALGLATFKMLDVNSSYTYLVTRDGYGNVEGDFLLKTDTVIDIGLLLGLDRTKPDQQRLRLWPVPFDNHLQVEWFQDADETAVLQIKDLAGRVLEEIEWSGRAGMNRASVNVWDLSPGIYLFSIQQNSKLASKKIFK